MSWSIQITARMAGSVLTLSEPWVFASTASGNIATLRLHTGIGPIHLDGPESPVFFADYIPASASLSKSAAVDANSGGDWDQVRGITLLIADQLANNETMTSLVEERGILWAGATVEVFDGLPEDGEPLPAPWWVGKVLEPKPGMTTIQLACEHSGDTKPVGEIVAGESIRPIVVGRGMYIKLPELEPIYEAAPDFGGLDFYVSLASWRFYTTRVPLRQEFNDGPATEYDPRVRVDIPNGETLAALNARFPGLTVNESGWSLVVVNGAGTGFRRLIRQGVAWAIESDSSDYFDLLKIPLDRSFNGPNGATLDPVEGIDSIIPLEQDPNPNRTFFKIEKSARVFAMPGRYYGAPVSGFMARPYAKVEDEWAVCFLDGLMEQPSSGPRRLIIFPGDGVNETYRCYFEPTLDQTYSKPSQANIRALVEQTATAWLDISSYPAINTQLQISAEGLSKYKPTAIVIAFAAQIANSTTPGEAGGLLIDLRARRFGGNWDSMYPRWRASTGASNPDGATYQHSCLPPWREEYPGGEDWLSRVGYYRLEAPVEELRAVSFLDLRIVPPIPPATTYLKALAFILEALVKTEDLRWCIVGPTFGQAPGGIVREIVPGFPMNSLVLERTSSFDNVPFTSGILDTQPIEDHVHAIEYLLRDHGEHGSTIDVASFEAAYYDMMAKSRASLDLPPVDERPKCSFVLTQVKQMGDVLAQIARDGGLIGGRNSAGKRTLNAFLARTWLAEQDYTISDYYPDHEGDIVLDQVVPGWTSIDDVVTAPLIRYAVEDGIPVLAVQVTNPDASTYSPDFCTGFLSPSQAEQAWNLCHKGWLRTGQVHARELSMVTVYEHDSLMRLLMPDRGCGQLEWMVQQKPTLQVTVRASLPVAKAPNGSRILVKQWRHAPGVGKRGTLVASQADPTKGVATLTIVLDPPQ